MVMPGKSLAIAATSTILACMEACKVSVGEKGDIFNVKGINKILPSRKVPESSVSTVLKKPMLA
jgi:hypothetical protein